MDQSTQAAPSADPDAMPIDAPWTEDQVIAALWRHFTDAGWAVTTQVTTHDDEGETDDTATHRRIDVLCWRRDKRAGVGLETLAIEVKTSRYDFTRDVTNPHKQATWRGQANRHAYAAPIGVIPEADVPQGCGLIEVERLVPARPDSPTAVSWVRTAPYPDRSLHSMPTSTMLTLLWRLSRADAELRGWADPTLAVSERELRAQVRAAERRAEKAERDAANATGKADAWKAAYSLAVPDGLPCRWCGNPVRPLRPGKGWFAEWKHVDAEDNEPCALLELVDREGRARAAYHDADEAARAYQMRLRTSSYLIRERFDWEAEPWRTFLELEARPIAPQAG